MKQQESVECNLFAHKFLSGIASGFVNSMLMTPVNGYSNYMIDKLAAKNMRTINPLRMFDGAMSYNVSLMFRVGVGLSVYAHIIQLLSEQGEIELRHNVAASFTAGSAAGVFCTLPEAVAQHVQQGDPKPSSMSVITNGYRANGLFGLTRGSCAMMMRSAIFSSGYLVLMPLLSETIHQKIDNRLAADLISAVVSGTVVSILSTPFNTLRSLKQANFTAPGAAPTYYQIINDRYHSASGLRSLFTGFGPRTPMLIFLMYCLPLGNKICGNYLDEGIRGLNNPKFGA